MDTRRLLPWVSVVRNPRARIAGTAAGALLVFVSGAISGRVMAAEPIPQPCGATRPAANGGGESSRFQQRYEELRLAELRSADAADSALAMVPVALPVRGATLTSTFTSRRFHPILRRVRPHWGVDLAAASGTPVLASADGTVLKALRNASYGNVVDVSHSRGRYITRYAHLSAIAVRSGDEVRRGQLIGRVGSTGLSSGPHLHFEVFVEGRRRDPALLLHPGAVTGLLR